MFCYFVKKTEIEFLQLWLEKPDLLEVLSGVLQ